MKRYSVVVHTDAQEDIERIYDFYFEISSALADRVIDTLEQAYDFLARMPLSCRRAKFETNLRRYREMIVDFGASGFLLLFEVTGEDEVTVIAIRHQRESDYH